MQHYEIDTPKVATFSIVARISDPCTLHSVSSLVISIKNLDLVYNTTYTMVRKFQVSLSFLYLLHLCVNFNI